MSKEHNPNLHFDSRVIHEAQSTDQWHGATLPPIFQSVSTRHDTAQSLSDTFAGRKKDHIYMRLSESHSRIAGGLMKPPLRGHLR